MKVCFILTATTLLLSACSKAPETNTVKAPSSFDAYIACQKSVKRLLKSPSTAKFASIGATKVKQTKRIRLESGADVIHFKVEGFVDAQNSFGALLRENYTCTAIGKSGSDWKVKSSLV